MFISLFRCDRFSSIWTCRNEEFGCLQFHTDSLSFHLPSCVRLIILLILIVMHFPSSFGLSGCIFCVSIWISMLKLINIMDFWFIIIEYFSIINWISKWMTISSKWYILNWLWVLSNCIYFVSFTKFYSLSF